MIDNDFRHADVLRTVTLELTAGEHAIDVFYFESGGEATLDLDWSGPGFGRQPMVFDGEATDPGDPTDPTDPPNPGTPTILGTAQADVIDGTDGDDIIDMLGGRDVLIGSSGNDRIDGGDAGYNQIDYDGFSRDYTFAANEDGTVTVVKPNGTDIISNIGGFWFTGEQVWIPLEDLVISEPGDGPNTIEGTNGVDFLNGTRGDDIIDLKGGRDVVNGSAGNDIIKGGDTGYNQVDYDGDSADYTFTRNTDGTITVVKPNGTDTLSDIGGFWFKGEGVWKPLDDVLQGGGGGDGDTGGATGGNDGGDDGGGGGDGGDNSPIRGTAGDDLIDGTAGNDVIFGGGGRDTIFGSTGNDRIDGQGGGYNQINYAGARADFAFSANANGSVTATSAAFGTDLLTNIDGVWFEGDGEWAAIDDLV